MQKAFTAAKKADARVRKLKEELVHGKAQWTQYSKKLRARYAAQEKQREQDVKKLEENIRAATENGQEAAKQVQELAMSGTATVLCLLTSSNRGPVSGDK